MSQIVSDLRIQKILSHFEFLQAKLNENLKNEELIKFSKEYAELKPIYEKIQEFNKIKKELSEAKELFNDPEFKDLAGDEVSKLEERLIIQDKELQLLLLPKDVNDNRSVILELRAGTGGDEAALFVSDLLRMYERYSDISNWKVESISSTPSQLGGFKEIILSISGENVFSKLKYESGVHRVQRVPETESGGRVHTSAATVAVLPEAEEVDVEIANSDIRIDTMRSSGAGGQHVNTTDSAVRITHLPTGIVVSQQDEKSQIRNKEKGLKILRSRIYEKERQIRDDERSLDRKSKIGTGDRSERIRTYNFPQGRVTDHRINYTIYKLDNFLNGDIQELINKLISEDQAKKIAENMNNA